MAAQPDNTPIGAVDIDPQETQEWRDALAGVVDKEGAGTRPFPDRGPDRTGANRASTFPTAPTPNTSTPSRSRSAAQSTPATPDLELRIHNYIRWNAMAMVVRANKHTNVGGHIASFASAAALYDVGFSHFWHAPTTPGGDLIFFQGHAVPGVYARAFMLGRLTPDQMKISARKSTARASRPTRIRG